MLEVKVIEKENRKVSACVEIIAATTDAEFALIRIMGMYAIQRTSTPLNPFCDCETFKKKYGDVSEEEAIEIFRKIVEEEYCEVVP